jgi:branched-chain amino acid transport system substrate-binding protein
VRARWLSCLAILAVAPLTGGCGVAKQTAATPLGDQLTVYSSLPLHGALAPVADQIENGEKLALSQAGGQIGPFKISFYSLNDAGNTSAEWDPGLTEANAKTAANDTSTIAYIGDFVSAATAVSLPLTNAAGILQVSPASPYGGLTSALDANQDEPERFYLTGKRSFGRLLPGDPVQAQAQVALMKSLKLGSVYVLRDQEDAFALPLAEMVVMDAQRAGIQVPADDGVITSAATVATSFAGEIAKIKASGAEAVFLSATPDAGTVALWNELHAEMPRLRLLGSSSLATSTFTSQLQAGTAALTYLATPLLPMSMYPPAAQAVARDYHRLFENAAEPYALYGYEAMSVVLAAIGHAGASGNSREAVIRSFFQTYERGSVLGRYSMGANGETSLTTYALDRVVAGEPVFSRLLQASG